MKKVILLVLILMMAVPASAVTLTVNLSDEEYKAMSVMTVTPEEWVQRAITNKANKMIESLVRDCSDKQPSKMNNAEKKTVIDSIDVEKEKEKRSGKKKK